MILWLSKIFFTSFHFHQPPNRELSTTRYHLSGEGSSYHDMPRSRPKQRPKAKEQSELDRSSVAKTEAKTCAFFKRVEFVCHDSERIRGYPDTET